MGPTTDSAVATWSFALALAALWTSGVHAQEVVATPAPADAPIPSTESPADEAPTPAVPDDGAALTELGLARIAQRDIAGAIDALTRARAVLPTDPLPVLALGHAYEWAGEPSRAREVYDAGLALHRGADQSHANDARYYVLLGHAAGRTTQNARRAYVRALELDPKNDDARKGLAAAFAAQAPQVKDGELAPEAERGKRNAPGPSGAAIVNPISLLVGAVTRIYAGGIELIVGGRRGAFTVYPQIGVMGDRNPLGLEGDGLGLGVLVGARANFGNYLSGAYVQPRFGPIRWSGDTWSFWAMVGEIEGGYAIPLSSSSTGITPMFQVGAGLRATVPSSDTITVPVKSDLYGEIESKVQLQPVIGPLFNLSFGIGWH